MKKLLLISLLASFGFANQCNYNYKQMKSNINKLQRAVELKMDREADRSLRMVRYYNSNVLLNCDKNSIRFKEAIRIKKILDR